VVLAVDWWVRGTALNETGGRPRPVVQYMVRCSGAQAVVMARRRGKRRQKAGNSAALLQEECQARHEGKAGKGVEGAGSRRKGAVARAEVPKSRKAHHQEQSQEQQAVRWKR